MNDDNLRTDIKVLKAIGQLSWLEHTVHTRGVEGSSPPLAITEKSRNLVNARL